ncbi:MAG: hypothetical protein COY80_04710 [Candidatus Pacebacteria bacterium CG_4_10_14_0_8_um_filter_42_14]|nr:MAG: hypothetical protein COY80_04710 [Candidatus Pacebacteria bacterium CG_4_10_14_0_8_um_filter_42_14]
MSPFRNKKFVIAVAVMIVLLAAAVRLYKLGSIPVALYIDEVAMLADVKSVLATGHDIHGNNWYQLIYPSYGDYKLPVYIWLVTAVSSVIGASDFSLRLVSALAGIGTVIIAGLLAKELAIYFSNSNKHKLISSVFPLATMFVVAISPWSVMFSRTGFEGHLAQFFVWLSIYLILTSKKRRWLFILGVLFGVLSVYTYYSVRFVWPVIFVSTLLLQLWYEPTKHKLARLFSFIAKIVLGLLLLFVFLMPLEKSPYFVASEQLRMSTDSIISFERYSDIVIRSNDLIKQSGATLVDRLIFHRYFLWLKDLSLNYSRNLSFDFLFFSGDSNLRHGTGAHGVFLLAFLPFLLIGLISLLREKPVLATALFIMILAALLPASVPMTTPHALRSINALVPFSVYIGYGIAIFVNSLITLYEYHREKVIFLSILALMIVIFTAFDFFHYYFVIYPKSSSKSWFACEQKLQQLISSRDHSQVLALLNSPKNFFLWYLAYSDINLKFLEGKKSREDSQSYLSIKNIVFDSSISELNKDYKQEIIFKGIYLSQIEDKGIILTSIRPINSEEKGCDYMLAQTQP